ncbi:class I SAM-dependent methyltransferase [Microbacterium sp. SD291]|uniref:class I SAM-dependent methyltransferase n=1 Tax=Microbacterium sp. SD291 TaxID=2782007 RepID=UPI001A95B305|nr:class I SAM-dependent methyltransferase [Microbacterium sp. SD291]
MRMLWPQLPADVTYVATDLNQPMLDFAASALRDPRVRWQVADATDLPFDDASFDVVLCQFGAMFFPDRVRAFSEARRVLAPGGTFLFNVWDAIDRNDFAAVITDALGAMFPENAPRFLPRTPHGYHDVALIRQDLTDAGFGSITIETVTAQSVAPSALAAATAYCRGTVLRTEIETRDAGALDEATHRAAAAIAAAARGRRGPRPDPGARGDRGRLRSRGARAQQDTEESTRGIRR